MRDEKGITLIALMITIIILLILAGIGIALSIGENGILKKAENATEVTKESVIIEDIEMSIAGLTAQYYRDNTQIQTLLEYLTEKLKDYTTSMDANVNSEANGDTTILIYSGENGKAQFLLDKDGKLTLEQSGNDIKMRYKLIYNANGGTYTPDSERYQAGKEVLLKFESMTRDGYEFTGWATSADANVALYTQEQNNKLIMEEHDVILYAVWSKRDSLLGKFDNVSNGYDDVTIKGKIGNQQETITYSVHSIVIDGDLVLDGKRQVTGATLQDNVYEFGDATTDVASATVDAKNMVLLKVNGNLIINEGITLTACKSTSGYGGPKGLMINCTGTITNNGTISMTQRGARAEGQNVYLWQNEDGSFEYVPAIGSSGRAGIINSEQYSRPDDAENGVSRKTGGGGAGNSFLNSGNKGGNGSSGTSYSGGSGGGAGAKSGSGENAKVNGRCRWGWIEWRWPDGAGNPGAGSGGQNGTGGLLVIMSDALDNRGDIQSNGSTGGGAYSYGGSAGGSGAGSINIFYNQLINKGTITATGGNGGSYNPNNCGYGGKGGDGSISIGSIATGTYVPAE